ncbi:hypothetical protein HAX54_038045 [Datura stramonium]|uniref:BRX domain-containing protein n=1 Tax=Datura stramonium TaxID=4076 RepID=A0ABS8SHI5_DATST|nr:hypothetical protein [Datura stramonium]
MWGEGTGDGILGGGPHRIDSCNGVKVDSLLPKALESAVVLDVQNLACSGKYAALITSRGEMFSWGEESGGRLGYGVDSDVLHPKLIDSLSRTNIELVACGENHFCAVTLSGESYTWGASDFGLLGHGNEVSHWVPQKIVEFMVGNSSSSNCSSGKIFTWGDGDKGRLGDGDKESKLVPTCVAALVEPNFCQEPGPVRMFLAMNNYCFRIISLTANAIAECFVIFFNGILRTRSSKQKKKFEFNSSRVSPIPSSISQLGALNSSKSSNQVFASSKKFFSASVPGSRIVSRATSPTSRRHSPPRSTAPTPTLGGLTSPRIVVGDAKRTNESLSHEVAKLRAQAGGMNSSSILILTLFDQVHNQHTFQELESSVSNNQLLSNGSNNASNRTAIHNRQGNPEATTKNGGRTKECDSRNESEWVEQDEPGVYITLTSIPGGVKDLKRIRLRSEILALDIKVRTKALGVHGMRIKVGEIGIPKVGLIEIKDGGIKSILFD